MKIFSGSFDPSGLIRNSWINNISTSPNYITKHCTYEIEAIPNDNDSQIQLPRQQTSILISGNFGTQHTLVL